MKRNVAVILLFVAMSAFVFGNSDFLDAATNGDLNTVRRLSSQVNEAQRTYAAILAVNRGHQDVLEYIVSNHRDFVDWIKFDDGSYEHILVVAMKTKNLDGFNYLIDKVDVNWLDPKAKLTVRNFAERFVLYNEDEIFDTMLSALEQRGARREKLYKIVSTLYYVNGSHGFYPANIRQFIFTYGEREYEFDSGDFGRRHDIPSWLNYNNHETVIRFLTSASDPWSLEIYLDKNSVGEITVYDEYTSSVYYRQAAEALNWMSVFSSRL